MGGRRCDVVRAGQVVSLAGLWPQRVRRA